MKYQHRKEPIVDISTILKNVVKKGGVPGGDFDKESLVSGVKCNIVKIGNEIGFTETKKARSIRLYD